MKKKNKNILTLPPSINKLGSEFVTVFKKRRAGPADARRKRISDVAKGRSRKPRTAKEKAEDNPAAFPPRYWVKVLKEPDLVAAFLIDGKGEERGRVLAHLYPRSELKREYQLQLSTLSGRLGKAFTPWIVREAYLNRDVVGKGIGTAMYERILAEVSHLDGALLPQVSLTGEHPDSTGYPAAILWNRLSAKHRGEGWVVASSGAKNNPEVGDWRYTTPETFSLLGNRVLVYTVQGPLRLLIRQRDFEALGISALSTTGPAVATFFNNNGTVQGAHSPKNLPWVPAPIVRIPDVWMLDVCPEYQNILTPAPYVPLPPRAQERLREGIELLKRQASALSRELTTALRSHYDR